MNKILAWAVMLCAVSGAAVAGDYATTGSGNWNDAIWAPAPPDPFYPWSGDTATINSGHAVQMHWYAGWGGITVPGNIWPSDLTIVMDGGELQWLRIGGMGVGPKLDSLVQVKSASNFLVTIDLTELRSNIVDYGVGVTGTLTLAGSNNILSMTGGDRSGFSGGWDVGANHVYFGWSWTDPGTGDQLLGTGPVSINGGSLEFYNNAGTINNALTIGAGGGLIQVGGSGQSGTVQCAGAATLDGQLDLNGQAGSITISGKVSGAGKITTARLAAPGDPAFPTYKLTNATNDFSGGVEVGGATFLVDVDGVLGTGPVAVNGGSLSVAVDVTAPPPITVNTGGTITNLINRNAGANTLTTPFTVDGGTVAVGAGADAEYAGTITIASDSFFDAADRDMYASGDITGSAVLTKIGAQVLVLASANSLTGGVAVEEGTVQVDAAGGLGSGEAVAAGGTILSNIDDAFLSASQVVSDENGTVDLNSTENNATLRIKPGGALKVSAGSTVLNYTGTPIAGQATVHAEAGCILYEGFTHPTAAQFEVGDGGFGAFKATTTGDHIVGKYSGTIYRGLANTSGTATFSGSVTEAAATGGDPDPTEGVGMLATGPATFQYQSSTFTTVGTNTIKFYGAGAHVIQDSNSFNNDLEKFGTGMFKVSNADGISGVTLTMHAGRLDVDAPDALNNATVELKTDALFPVDQTLSAGTVNVQGGGVRAGGIAALGSGLFDWSGGGMLVMAGSSFDSAELPSNGKVNLILGQHDIPFTQTLQLGDNTRLTVNNSTPTNGGGGWWVGVLADIGLAGGQTQGRVAMRYQQQYDGNLRWLQLSGQVSMPTGTLIVGDTQDYRIIENTGTDWAYVTQNGMVRLINAANDIGGINVQGGVLYVDAGEPLGGAATIDVNAGATLRLDWNGPNLATVIGGTGNVVVGENGSGNSTLTLTPAGSQAAGVAPGASAGTLNVTGNLALSNNGADYAALNIEVVGAGTCDQVAVTGNLDVAGGNLAVIMDVPSVNYVPADLTGLEIATCGGTLTSPFNAVATSAFAGVGDAGVQTAVAAHWTIEADDVTYGSNNIVLDASNWTGFTGDADLSDFVDLADLSTLAFNWEKSTGMTWLTADFDLNGTVNLADLSALAFHWEQSASGGAPPVPEPMTVGLLAVGAAALLRRRRR